jgi:hypothetical protein
MCMYDEKKQYRVTKKLKKKHINIVFRGTPNLSSARRKDILVSTTASNADSNRSLLAKRYSKSFLLYFTPHVVSQIGLKITFFA